ncbi:hypothetical protein CVS30_02720 [Arthrobacter psychrolactophilus]|uniref:Uncharacterized protein n=2 Tax=Arthrobacter psychrolactophilus TaxID=92442 RepID=A0A2V5IVX2_9MICC|nr:hypothetical protein CVS30_02720 [Arthrobacter psychrolactophilus]
MIVPLGSVRKGALKNVDTSGAGASSLSILGAEDNGNYAVAMLRMLAQSLLGEELGGSARCRDVVTAVVRATTESCDASTNEFSVWLADCLELVADEDKGAEFDRSVDLFREFVLQFATTFLLLVEVNDNLAGTRCVIKYSRDDTAPEQSGIRSQQAAWEIPDYGFARSYHLEVEVPPGLVYKQLEIVEYGSNGTSTNRAVDAPSKPQVLAHLACAPSERMATAVAGLTLAPSRQGQYKVARFSVWITFAVALAAWGSSLVPGVIVSDASGPVSAAVSLLLTGPALLLSWFSRSPEHEVVAWIMGPYRKMLLMSVLTLFLLAASAAVPLVSPTKELVWFPVLFVQVRALGLSLRHTSS